MTENLHIGRLEARMDGRRVVVDVADDYVEVSDELLAMLVAPDSPEAGVTFTIGTAGHGLGEVTYEVLGRSRDVASLSWGAQRLVPPIASRD